jgi:hypothetical protein
VLVRGPREVAGSAWISRCAAWIKQMGEKGEMT